MGLFESIFKRPDKALEAVNGYFKTLTMYQPAFTTFEGGVYEAMQTRAAIHAFATHVSKLKPEIVGSRNKRLDRVLQHRPNPYMSTTQFLYRTATIFAATNNAFIVPMYANDMQTINGYYPLLPERVEIVSVGGKPYLRYTFGTGQRAAIEYDRAGVMTQMQYRDDFFGDSNAKVLDPTLQMINMQNQGIVEGVKMGAALRFIARLAQTFKPETLEKERKNLRETNLSMENNGGFLLVDSKYADIKQIESKPYIIDADQMKLINDNVYNYFGVNEAILQNKFDEPTFNAWYEGKIEPFAVALGMALTNMTFTDHEISFGNEIMFSANRLQYATTQAKLLVSQQLFDRGVLSRNDVRDIFQLPHVIDGDTYFIRGEYQTTDKKTADQPKPEEPPAPDVPPDQQPPTNGQNDPQQKGVNDNADQE